MKLIAGSSDSLVYSQPVALTFGNFDGVHQGHQFILKKLQSKAKELGLPVMVLLFEPQPLEFLNPTKSIVRISSLRDKISALDRCGVDLVACLRFNHSLAARSANWMVQDLLISRLQAQFVLVGEDSRFGCGREGDAHYLCKSMYSAGLGAEIIPNIETDGLRVSSTRIRNALQAGDFNLVNMLLGRPYSVCGRVGFGAQLARQWGVPTANICIRTNSPPIFGVFAVLVKDQNGCITHGIANWGLRPTIDGLQRKLEIHRFDWTGSLYGQFLEVKFLHKIRNELKFSSLDALVCQINHDIQQAKAFFEQNDIERIVS